MKDNWNRNINKTNWINYVVNLAVSFYFSLILVTCLAQCRGSIFFAFEKNQDLKILSFFAKLYPRVLGLVATPDPRVIFIILIITLNLS